MKKRIFAALAACTMLLTGCSAGQGADANTNDTAQTDGELHELTVVLDWYRTRCTLSCIRPRRPVTLLKRV